MDGWLKYTGESLRTGAGRVDQPEEISNSGKRPSECVVHTFYGLKRGGVGDFLDYVHMLDTRQMMILIDAIVPGRKFSDDHPLYEKLMRLILHAGCSIVKKTSDASNECVEGQVELLMDGKTPVVWTRSLYTVVSSTGLLYVRRNRKAVWVGC